MACGDGGGRGRLRLGSEKVGIFYLVRGKLCCWLGRVRVKFCGIQVNYISEDKTDS